MSFQKTRWSSIALLGILLTFVAYAQIRSGTITGSVTDPTSAVVVGAEVVITNQENNITSATKTTDAGQFTFPYLQAGLYSVAVNMPGFAPYRQTGIALATAPTVRVEAIVKVGAIDQAVEVS